MTGETLNKNRPSGNAANLNPFPGLRPFREGEEDLFFGRDSQVDAMVDKLAATRFLSVVGSSGSGKSSLVNCGLRPALQRGLMSSAGSAWRIVRFQPGNDPIGEMARALSSKGALFSRQKTLSVPLVEIIENTLRMSKLGLIDIYKQAKLDAQENLMLVVDQFEELFRYQKLEEFDEHDYERFREEAIEFVNLLLAVKRQTKYPIYVVLTMRTDFLADCTKFPGLAEAINAGQYLVPRLTRDERRAAISGPVGVSNAEISPVLLTRLVNDVGDDPDQLSILQHALNRTWARWYDTGREGPLDLVHYNAVGTMAHALDKHAERAYSELKTPRLRQICEKLFKVITDKASDPRGVRRPKKFRVLCAMIGADESKVIEVIDVFRDPNRSFLMPPAGNTIRPDSVVDISHESLMRVWQRLNEWADAEANSAALYIRLVDAADRYMEGQANLWRGQELQLALDWREREKPTAPWAQLYRGGFDRADAFLQKCKDVHDSELADLELGRILRIARNVILGFVLASLLMGPLGLASGTIKSEFYNISGLFADSQRDASTPFVILDEAEIKMIETAQSQAVEKGYSVLNSARIGEKLEQLFRMTKTTPFQMNNVRLALERKALAIAPSDIDYFLDRNSDEDKQTDGRLSGGGQKKKNVSDALKKIKDSLSPILISVEESDEIIILLFPPNVEITSKREEQSWLVSAVLGSPYFKEQVLGKRENSERKFRASILLAHLILYLIFVFSIGLVYRKLEYRDRGNVPDLKSAPTPWHFRVGSFMSGINKLLAPLRSWWSKLAIYTVALIGVLLFVYSGAHASFVWLPLGVLALLLFPPSSVLKKSWAVSIKIAQAILLQVIGFFAFSAAIYLLTGGGQFAGDSLAPTFWKPSFFFISAIVLIFLGKVKFALTNDEKLAREPNRAPVVYVRSFDNARQDWRQAWAASSTRFLRPVEEQVLSSIFGALGPFITTGRSVEDLSRSAAEKEVIQARRKRDSQLIDRSELVILQIDEGPTGEYLANIRKILLSLKPGQVLVYFSHLMNPDLLRQTYERFIEETLDVFPNPLPFSIGSKRLLAFDDDWTPRLIGEVSRPKFLFGKFLPVVGRWLDTFFARRSVARTLKPFFENRNLVDPRLRLFSELSIGVASFPLFGLFPAGYMMFINLWRAGRRTVAVVGFFAPVIFFLIFIFAHGFFGQYLIFISQSWVVEETLFVGTLITIIFGFPFATHWTWKRFSGRLIGQHEAFGGTLQPFWKSLLPPVVGVLLLVALAGVRYQFVIAPQNARVEAWDIARKGREFAEKGKLEDAVTRFEEALERSPEIDLVFETQRIDRVPKAVAHVWYGVRLAELGDIDGAVTNFRKAQELDSEIVLDPDREFYRDSREPDRDPRIVAKRLRSYILIDKGRELALDGKKEAAIKDFKKALELDKNADLNPNTDEKEQVPEAVYFVLRGGKLAEEGDVEKATEAFNAALITLEGIKLPNGTDRPDDDKGRDPKKAAQALAASVKVNDGRDLAQKGALDKAIDAFSKALKLDPQFDLNPMTKSIESNPEAVALVWYGARSAEQGNLTEAIDSFRKARKLDPKIELDPNGNFDSDLNDPQKVANYLASRVNRKL